MNKVLLTTNELAQACGVSPDTVLQWERVGDITPLRNRGTKNRLWHVETCIAQMRKRAGIDVQNYMQPIKQTEQ